MTKLAGKFNATLLAQFVLAGIGTWLSYQTVGVHVNQALNLTAENAICNLSASFDCGAVAASKYSQLFGLPLGFYGMAFFLTLCLLILQTYLVNFFTRLEVISLIFIGSVLASIGSVLLFLISKFAIGELCSLCIGIYLVNFILLAIGLYQIMGLCRSKVQPVLRASWHDFCKRFAAFPVAKKFSDSLLLVTAFVLILLFCSFTPKYLKQQKLTEQALNVDFDTVALLSVDLDNQPWGDYYFGDPSAPVQIVEFADFQCPMCRILGQNIKEWLEPYAGKYYFVFKNYPLDPACNESMNSSIHPSACMLAHFARCAGEQEQFWPAYDALNDLEQSYFELPKNQQLEELINGLADVNKSVLKTCVDEQRYKEAIRKDIFHGNELSISGTPSLFVNGQLLKSPTKGSLQQLVGKLVGDKK